MMFLRLLLIKLSIFAVIFSGNVAAQGDKYFVEGVVAYADSKSPALSRSKASLKARKIALNSLVERVGVKIDVENLTDEQVLDLIVEERVVHEVISNNSYSGRYNIRFSEELIEGFTEELKRANEARNEVKSLKLLMLPILSKDGQMVIWGDDNVWAKALKNEIKQNSELNIQIIDPDIHNLSIINSYNISMVSDKLIEELFGKYKVDVIYFTFYSYNKKDKKARLTIRGYNGSDSDEYRLAFANANRLSNSYLRSHIAKKLMDYIENDGLKMAEKDNADDSAIRIEVPVRRVAQWLAIEKRLEKSSFITYFKVKSFSKDFVKIDLRCKDNINIVENFKDMGFDLVFRSQDVYLLTSR